MDEQLNKSIDSLIDELFAEPTVAEAPKADAPAADAVEKSMVKDMASANKQTADEAVSAAPKGEKDEARGAGRPKQISDVPQTDTDGARSGEYDGKIASPQSDASKKEDSQVAPPANLKKSLSDAEYEEYQALKKAKAAAEQAETLEKARKETSDLIKSAVTEATSGIRKENEDLRKALKEQGDLIKSIANKPQRSKAVTNVGAVEKFAKSESANFSKADLLDIAEDLVKSKKLTMENVIELENTGFIYDSEARGVLEREVNRRSRS